MSVPERLVMVSLDGLCGRALDDAAAPLPVLGSLAARGVRVRSLRPVFPSVTWPCHTSLVTGVGPARHGVLGNLVFDRTRNDVVQEDGDRLHLPIGAPTLWDRVHAAGGRVAAFCWPKTRNSAAIPDNIPEFYDQPLFEAHASPELWRELRGRGLPVDRYGPWSTTHATTPMQDWLTLEAALHVLATRPPRLLLVHFLMVDAFQHDHGVDSAEARWARAHADLLLGRLLEALEPLGGLERNAVMVFGDHGFVDVETAHYPNQVLCEEGLLELDADGGVRGRRAWAASNAGAAHVYVLDGAPRHTAARLKERFQAWSGVAVHDAETFPELGLPRAHPMQGDLVLVAPPEAQFRPHATVEAAAATRAYKATHGHDPALPALGASLVMAGPGLRSGGIIDSASMLDVAPTAAHLLGVDLPGAEGLVLTAALVEP